MPRGQVEVEDSTSSPATPPRWPGSLAARGGRPLRSGPRGPRRGLLRFPEGGLQLGTQHLYVGLLCERVVVARDLLHHQAACGDLAPAQVDWTAGRHVAGLEDHQPARIGANPVAGAEVRMYASVSPDVVPQLVGDGLAARQVAGSRSSPGSASLAGRGSTWPGLVAAALRCPSSTRVRDQRWSRERGGGDPAGGVDQGQEGHLLPLGEELLGHLVGDQPATAVAAQEVGATGLQAAISSR